MRWFPADKYTYSPDWYYFLSCWTLLIFKRTTGVFSFRCFATHFYGGVLFIALKGFVKPWWFQQQYKKKSLSHYICWFSGLLFVFLSLDIKLSNRTKLSKQNLDIIIICTHLFNLMLSHEHLGRTTAQHKKLHCSWDSSKETLKSSLTLLWLVFNVSLL